MDLPHAPIMFLEDTAPEQGVGVGGVWACNIFNEPIPVMRQTFESCHQVRTARQTSPETSSWPLSFSAMGTAPHFFFFFFFPVLIFICISGAFDDDLSVFAVIMCAALAQQKQLCYKPDIKTKLDACVPQHLGHQCPINTSSQSISPPSLLRSLMKPWVGNKRVWTI